MRASKPLVFVACLVLAYTGPLRAESYVAHTFRQEIADGTLLVFARLEEGGDAPDKASSNLVISTLVQRQPPLRAGLGVTIPRKLLRDGAKPHALYLLYADVTVGGCDFYRAEPATSATVAYLKGLTRIDARDDAKVLRYCADYLGHKDKVIADDAYREFSRADDKALCDLARHVSPRALRARLLDRNAPPHLLQLYGFLLGTCGGEADARALRAVIDRLAREEERPVLDRLLIGYTLLKREEAWWRVRHLMSDAKAPFSTRYSCLRAARYFHDKRPDVLPAADVLAVHVMGLDQTDMADLPIDDLRKWHYWKLTDRILSIYDDKSYELPVVKRSVLRYALQCPDPAAAEFVSARRKADRDLVADMEELLRLEEPVVRKK
jgi:hypothetical protein